jgi:predicted PurR-regulated permease PerM
MYDSPRTTVAEPTRGQLIARAVLALGLFLLGLYTLQGFLPALAWAGVFAIAIWPVYTRAQRRFPPGKHNIVLPALFTLGVALLFILPLALVALQLSREAHGVMHWVRGVQRNGLPVPAFVGHLPVASGTVTAWWQDNLSTPQGANELVGRLNRGEVVEFSRHIGSQLMHRAVLFGFTLLTLFFLFRDGLHLSDQMLRASQRAFGPRGERVGRQIIASVHGTVDGLVLVGLGEGVLMGIAYAVAGVPHATLFGAVTAVAAMIPFGALLAVGLAALLLLATGSTAWAVGIFALGLVVIFVSDHFVRPVLIGGSTRLPFLWVLFGILGGVEVWGLLGLFLGPAIMAALILLWREWADGAPA